MEKSEAGRGAGVWGAHGSQGGLTEEVALGVRAEGVGSELGRPQEEK